MTTEHLRFWIEHNVADMEPVKAVLPQLARVFPMGGIVQGSEVSLKRIVKETDLLTLWKREAVVLMGKLPGWFQGMDLSKPEAFLDVARWAVFALYETAYEIPPGPFGIDAESWTSMFLNAGADAHHIQTMVRRFRGYARERDWPTYCYQPSLWNDDPRRVQLCTGIFGQPHSGLRWHEGRWTDPTQNDHAIRCADQSDMISEVKRFTKCNCGGHPDSQYTPEMLLRWMPNLPKPVYCYFGSVANVATWCDAIELLLKGQA